jgi:GNAT superfamily N-acetyltransferase
MKTKSEPAKQKLSIHPLTPERWEDFAKLFGPRGACANCWCMWWRLSRGAWVAGKSGGNRRAMRKLAAGKVAPGLMAFVDGEPAGWLALAPRADYPKLAGSRVLAPVDDQPVWSVTCFFVAREFRGRGLTVALLEAAAKFAKRNGARILEGYPTETKSRQAAVFVFTGLAPAFRKAGFAEAARRSRTRPIFRKVLRA